MQGRFFYRFILFVVSLVIADRVIGFVMNYEVHKQRNGNIYELRYKLIQAKPEVAILGSSRANHHYNIGIIEKATGKKAMNYGQDGTNVFFHYITLKTLLRSHKPKLVVLDIKPGDFGEMPNFNETATLYPIINEVAVNDEDLKMISAYEKVKLYCQCYRYNNQVLEIINSARGKIEDKAAITGYLPLAAQKVVLNSTTINNNDFNAEIYKYFPRIVELCQQNNVKLIVCTSPCYDHVVFDRTIALTEELCRRNSVEYINYLNNKLIYFGAGLFNDEFHLNSEGADIFTKDFVDRIKRCK